MPRRLAALAGRLLLFSHFMALFVEAYRLRSMLFILPLLALSIEGAIVSGAPMAEPAETVAIASRQWVRTADGWEPLSHVLAAPAPPPLPTPHPFLVAAFVGLGSTLVLVAFDERKS